ncbi:MAG: hypothetical protein JXC36_07745, partial [Candidatus Atribacteria bacterium]|nr:hypothetical protein [Candidatus Atribacteria bacterium]
MIHLNALLSSHFQNVISYRSSLPHGSTKSSLALSEGKNPWFPSPQPKTQNSSTFQPFNSSTQNTSPQTHPSKIPHDIQKILQLIGILNRPPLIHHEIPEPISS